MTREILVVGAARTAIGSFGGSLKDVPLTRLATEAARATPTNMSVPKPRRRASPA